MLFWSSRRVPWISLVNDFGSCGHCFITIIDDKLIQKEVHEKISVWVGWLPVNIHALLLGCGMCQYLLNLDCMVGSDSSPNTRLCLCLNLGGWLKSRSSLATNVRQSASIAVAPKTYCVAIGVCFSSSRLWIEGISSLFICCFDAHTYYTSNGSASQRVELPTCILNSTCSLQITFVRTTFATSPYSSNYVKENQDRNF